VIGMTLTEKILAAHSGRDRVAPGELIEAELDLVLCHEITTPAAISMLERRGMDRVFDPAKIVAVPDHFVPNKDIQAAALASRLRDWVKRHGIDRYFEVGRNGIAHVLIAEEGFVVPGSTIVAGDSHTCNAGAFGCFATGVGSTDLAAAIYAGRLWFRVPGSMRITLTGELQAGVYPKDVILEVIRRIGVDGANSLAMEWVGPALEGWSMEDRMTLTNMAIEAGAKTGVIAADEVTRAYLAERGVKEYPEYRSDLDAAYVREEQVDLDSLEPVVAFPHLPSNGRPVGEGRGIRIDQAYIGSCTNARLSDLREAAAVLRGHQVAPGVRMIVVPATSRIWRQAMKEGLWDVFSEAGAVVANASCGACLGGYMGVVGEGEVCLSSTNRNFVGRMGHPKSEVYLASPATVAASAITGEITDPRPFVAAARRARAA